MKLYTGDLSPYSARVRMQIYAKGITDIALERPADFGLPAFRKRLPIGRIRTLARIGDVYLMNNMFMLSPQSRAARLVTVPSAA